MGQPVRRPCLRAARQIAGVRGANAGRRRQAWRETACRTWTREAHLLSEAARHSECLRLGRGRPQGGVDAICGRQPRNWPSTPTGAASPSSLWRLNTAPDDANHVKSGTRRRGKNRSPSGIHGRSAERRRVQSERLAPGRRLEGAEGRDAVAPRRRHGQGAPLWMGCVQGRGRKPAAAGVQPGRPTADLPVERVVGPRLGRGCWRRAATRRGATRPRPPWRFSPVGRTFSRLAGMGR